MDAALLEAIVKSNRRGRIMGRIIRALLVGGARDIHVLRGLCGKQDPRGETIERMRALDMLVMTGVKRAARYDLSPRVRAAAKKIPTLNPA